jgi:hypothetical protein
MKIESVTFDFHSHKMIERIEVSNRIQGELYTHPRN